MPEQMSVDAAGHDAAVRAAVAALRAGLVVALPTETVYGIAALPDRPDATARLFALKQRAEDVPIAVLCADADQALGLADPAALGSDARRLAARLWPGPLTMVLPRRPGLGYALGEPAKTIGVRCPDHRLVQALAAEVGPLATTSANRHGQATPPEAGGVAAALGDGVALVLDGGRCAGVPSTVVDLTGSRWHVLREGELSAAAIEAVASQAGGA